MDFKLSKWIYDNAIEELFGSNADLLHKLFKYIHKVMENTLYVWFDASKDLVLSIIAGLVPMLP
jgi:hypothetical protein